MNTIDGLRVAGKRIVVGVTGGIAAYKAVEICRRLVDAGAHVTPVMTAGAEHFVGRTTLSALCSEPVQTSLWDEDTPIPHTRLGQSADLILIVPATARLLAAYTMGLSTDLLTNTLQSAYLSESIVSTLQETRVRLSQIPMTSGNVKPERERLK